VFNLFWRWWEQQIIHFCKLTWKLKPVILLLCWVLFSLSVCNNCFRFSNFEIPILKYLKNCRLSSFRRPGCKILLPLRLLETHCKSSIFVLLTFLLLQEDKVYMQSLHSPHNRPCSYDCKEWLYHTAKENSLNRWNDCSDFSGCYMDFHERHSTGEDGRRTARHVWISVTWQNRFMAWYVSVSL
jgi:hypothetical protein